MDATNRARQTRFCCNMWTELLGLRVTLKHLHIFNTCQGDFKNWRTLSRVLCKVPVTGKLETLAVANWLAHRLRSRLAASKFPAKRPGCQIDRQAEMGGSGKPWSPHWTSWSSFSAEPLRLAGCLPLKCPEHAPTHLGALDLRGAAPGPLPLVPGQQAASRR